VLAIALQAGCALPVWMHDAPIFPGAPGAWEVPLYEPLQRIGPYVLATVSGQPPPGAAPAREEVLLCVDSGTTRSELAAPTFAHLGVETTTSHLATIEDAAGVTRGWSGGLVPSVELGNGLTLANVVASVGRTPILGADVLDAQGWQIDLDRGTLVLGARPWPAAPEVVVPTHPFRNHALVDLRIAGQLVPVLIDTGAPFTVVDGAVLRELGLRAQPLAHPWPLGVGS
jgi:hypothetical protein